MKASRIAAIVAGSLALLAVGSCGGAHALADARARQFESACGTVAGRTYAERLAPFGDLPITEMEMGPEVTVSHRYSLSRSVHCTLEVERGRVLRAEPSRTSDFDLCSDTGIYPRRHWLCSAARVVMP